MTKQMSLAVGASFPVDPAPTDFRDLLRCPFAISDPRHAYLSCFRPLGITRRPLCRPGQLDSRSTSRVKLTEQHGSIAASPRRSELSPRSAAQGSSQNARIRRNVRLRDVDIVPLRHARRRMAHEPGHGVSVHTGFGPACAAGMPPAIGLKRLNSGLLKGRRTRFLVRAVDCPLVRMLNRHDVTALTASGKHKAARESRRPPHFQHGLRPRSQWQVAPGTICAQVIT
jgi:hypothetical protein